MMSNTSWYWTVSVHNDRGMTVAHAMLWDQVGCVIAWTSENGPVPEPEMLFPGMDEDTETWVNGLWALFSAVEVMVR